MTPTRKSGTPLPGILAAASLLLFCLLGCETNPAAPLAAAAQAPAAKPDLLFTEGFDGTGLLQRGWYDGGRFKIAGGAQAGKGCIEYHWPQGATTPVTSQVLRRLFEPAESVYLRFSMKLSPGFGWTGRGYHPHLIQFMTTENARYHGPAGSHLTLYVEPWDGKLRLAAQDIQNQDAPHGLTQGPIKGGFNGSSGTARRSCSATTAGTASRPISS